MLLTIVDNCPLAGQPHHVAAIRRALDERFRMTWDEVAEDVCGIYFDYLDDGSIRVHQWPYIEEILNRLGLLDVTTGPATPLDAKFNIDPDDPDDDGGGFFAGRQRPPLGVEPREAIGWLMYLRPTIPSLSRAAHALATAVNVRGDKQEARLYRLFLWLASHWKDLSVLFSATYRGKFELRAFVDENYGCELATNARGKALSRLGGFILLNGGCIYSASHRACVSCYSTAEVGLLAISLVVRCLIGVRRLLLLGTGQQPRRTYVRSDNHPALKTINRRQLNSRMRHFNIALNGILTAIDSDDVATTYVKSDCNPANTLASYEPAQLFERNTKFMTGHYSGPDFTTLSRPDEAQYITNLKKQQTSTA
mmetsp:Transcript_31028/g.100013  ORF Transcript_31028/g.100013 Transcript_31028/m.100013 type:complete len:366 (-) Transcript_31028:350-1447(-)